MSNSIRVVMSALLICVALVAGGCGSSKSGSHHALAKSVALTALCHHELKKHGSSHALAKCAAIGAVAHHEIKKHG